MKNLMFKITPPRYEYVVLGGDLELATQQAVLTLRECRLFAHLYACVPQFFFAALLLVAGLLPTVPACAQAQETEPALDTLVTATLAADTIDNTDPEWYVAPEIPVSLRAPKRAAAAAASCKTDTLLTYDSNSVLTEATVYEYDEAGRTVGTTVWAYNADGSRVGKSRTEDRYDASGVKVMTAAYTWDNTLNDWIGLSKTEYTFENGKNTVTNISDWLNGDWSVKTQYTYAYDAAGRETEYTTYDRNTAGVLVYSKLRIRDYNASGKTTLDIQYTAHNGSDWSAGTKREYVYDAFGNQSEYTYCSAYSNGSWVNSIHETTTYNAANKMTFYLKETWSSNAWITSAKEIYEYNAAGSYLLIEKYALKSGVLAGSSKQTYEYNAVGLQIGLITYKWTNNAWVNNVWTVTGYDDAKNKIETCKYTWKNNKWTGSGDRVLQTFNAKKKVTEKITQKWSSAVADWVNSARLVYAYDAKSRKIQEFSYAWQDNQWTGIYLIDWHYNASGKNDTITTSLPNGADWTLSTRTVYTYDAKGNTVCTHYADWNGTAWIMVSMERTDIAYEGANQVSNASWACGNDSIWYGVQKDSTAYSPTGKTIFNAQYTWTDNDWAFVYKIETTYDAADREMVKERYDWVDEAMKGTSRYEKIYDEQGHLLVDASYLDWNSVTGTWIGNSKIERTYEQGKEASLTLYEWGTTDWLPTTRFSYTYDAADHEILQVAEKYSNGNWSYANKYEKEYKGSALIKNNSYVWLQNQWVFTSRNETYYDDDAQAKLRRQITGSWNGSTGSLISYTDNRYSYDCDALTIRFVNYDGTLLETQEVNKGETPVYTGATPVRDSNAEHTYTFAGWTPKIAPATGNVTYTATFTDSKNTYTVTWKNEDGSVIESETLEYGATPAHADITKENTPEYTYTFTGWTPGIGIVTGDAEYTATFKSTKNSYTINWLNSDNSPLAQTTVAYGESPVYTGEKPSRPTTAEYTYTFAGWDKEIVPVEGDATYTATYDSVRNSYTVTWLNEDGSLIASETLEYGATPAHADIVKENTPEWTYTFAGWSPAIALVEGDATYQATFTATKNSYTINWLNSDNSPLVQTTVAYGESPVYTGEKPSRPTTAQYTYTFAGWTPEVETVTEAATYTATYDSIVNRYTVTWLNEDGSLIASEALEYGATPAHEDVAKDNTAEYTYTFAGWTPVIALVEGDATYQATFTATKNSYTITWLNEDGSLIASETLEYGATPAHADITKENTPEYTYTFAGWTPQVEAVTGNAEYTATFTATKRTYTVNWLNADNSPLAQTSVAYGESPVYTGEKPSRPTTAEYTYTFAGWDKEIVPVEGDATYTATYDSLRNSYTVTFYYEDGVTVLDQVTVQYGETPATSLIPSKYSEEHYYYTFYGWSPEVVPAEGNASYKATFTAVPKQYTVTFKNHNGRTLLTTETPYGEIPEYTGETPTRTKDKQYTYTFSGWSPELTEVTGPTTYTAVFEGTLNQYTVIFLDEDGTELDRQTLDYGTMPVYEGETPTKDDEGQYGYTFKGWSPKLTSVTKNATYRAVYTRYDKTQGIEDVQPPYMEAQKILIGNTIYILRGGKTYTLQGVEVR